jgi:hypothetical protein
LDSGKEPVKHNEGGAEKQCHTGYGPMVTP